MTLTTNRELGPLSPTERSAAALEVRVCAARAQNAQPHPVHSNNGDDQRYADARASFTKGLPHQNNGLVDRGAYQTLLDALEKGDPAAFERIRIGGSRRLVNPQAGLAFDMQGADAHALTIPPAPAFDSDELAAEIVDNYWMALLRDVHFDEYPENNLAREAAEELTGFGGAFKGSKTDDQKVTRERLFRGLTPGDNVGPYLSQFLMLPVPFGAQGFTQTMLTPKRGVDFMTDWPEYLAVQRGEKRDFDTDRDFEPTPVLIRNGRDLSQWVHIDVLFQAYFNAALILLQGPNAPTPLVCEAGLGHLRPDVRKAIHSGLGVTVDSGNPYLSSIAQEGFGTFGPPYIAATLCEVATRALKAVWFQKWFVHRRFRPEAFAARIHTDKKDMTHLGVPEKARNANVLEAVADHNNRVNSEQKRSSSGKSYLLPMAFREGSPVHPAYGAGHATVAGACVTILKAFFAEEAPIRHPMRVGSDGRRLEPYTGRDCGSLTVGGELNKLASNVAIGRNIAGVHWRSDGTESLFLSEQVAIAMLRDHRLTFNERFAGYELTTFAGNKIRI